MAANPKHLATFAGGLLALAAVALTPATAIAGMPSITLNDVVKLRLEVISFFLGVLLLSAAAIYGLWNWLQRDFTWLPRLTYAKACGIVTLWGILFVIVLTMISGARELMTPGAWERDGWTYRLKEADEPPEEKGKEPSEREHAMGKLRAVLMAFAASHSGRYPSAEEVEALPQSVFRMPDPHGMRYVYVAGRTMDDQDALLAYEPTVYGEDSLVLSADGGIRRLSYLEINRLRYNEASDGAK